MQLSGRLRKTAGDSWLHQALDEQESINAHSTPLTAVSNRQFQEYYLYKNDFFLKFYSLNKEAIRSQINVRLSNFSVSYQLE